MSLTILPAFLLIPKLPGELVPYHGVSVVDSSPWLAFSLDNAGYGLGQLASFLEYYKVAFIVFTEIANIYACWLFSWDV